MPTLRTPVGKGRPALPPDRRGYCVDTCQVLRRYLGSGPTLAPPVIACRLPRRDVATRRSHLCPGLSACSGTRPDRAFPGFLPAVNTVRAAVPRPLYVRGPAAGSGCVPPGAADSGTSERGPRDGRIPSSRAIFAGGGRCWVRTNVGSANGFTGSPSVDGCLARDLRILRCRRRARPHSVSPKAAKLSGLEIH